MATKEPQEDPLLRTGGYDAAKSSKFRFKSSKRGYESENSKDGKSKRRKHEHSSSSHSQGTRRKKSYSSTLKDDPGLYDDTYLPNSHGSQFMDPDTAFRESLFDALADDEGAAYWEGVYGQPIHVYSNQKPGPDGELERMTEEEYAAHVRNKMWERSHGHIVEERRRREEARAEQRARDAKRHQETAERMAFDSSIDEALRRGRKRRKEQDWIEAWKHYTERWEKLLASVPDSNSQIPTGKAATGMIPWPVRSGSHSDVDKDQVELFFRNAPSDDKLMLLKAERITWHPDKMQHRLSRLNLDEDAIRTITGVFQIVDNMWSEMNHK